MSHAPPPAPCDLFCVGYPSDFTLHVSKSRRRNVLGLVSSFQLLSRYKKTGNPFPEFSKKNSAPVREGSKYVATHAHTHVCVALDSRTSNRESPRLQRVLLRLPLAMVPVAHRKKKKKSCHLFAECFSLVSKNDPLSYAHHHHTTVIIPRHFISCSKGAKTTT